MNRRSARADPERSASRIPIERLQAADRVLGWLACALLQLPRHLRPTRALSRPTERLLLIKFWGIGSLQLLTPAVGALRRRHPVARLVLLTLYENEAFARGLGTFDEVLVLDVACRSWLQLFARIVRIVLELRRRRFDRVIDFEFFTRFSAVVSFLARARSSVGFAAPGVWRGRLHREEVPFNRYWHVARNFRALAGGENGKEVRVEEVAAYEPTPTDRASMRSTLEARGLSPDRAFIVLNPNAGRLSLERRWPTSNFAALARRLIDEEECSVVFIGAPAERGYVASIVREVGPAPGGMLIDLAGCLSIGELAALLTAASAVVSNDSGPMHVAAACGTPTLGLFGPETPTMYAPLGRRTEALWDPPVCSPCINVHENKVANCIHGRPECLVNLRVERVFQRTCALLEERLPAVLLHPAARRTELREPWAKDPQECASSS